MIWDIDKEKVVDCTTPMTYEEYKRMTNQYCRNVAHQQMTNEEWFASLPTEEKAKWMAKHMSFCEVCEIVTCRGDGCQRFDRGSMTETDAFREWLKKPHK